MSDIHLPRWLVVASWTVVEVCRRPLTPGASVRGGAIEGATRYREYAQVRRTRRIAASGAYMTDRAYGLVLHTQCLDRAARRRTRVLVSRELLADRRSVAAATSSATGELRGGDAVVERQEVRAPVTASEDVENVLVLETREDTKYYAYSYSTRYDGRTGRRARSRPRWDGSCGEPGYLGSAGSV